MKKLLFLCLTALTLQAPCFAYDAEVDGIYYNFDTTARTATVTYYVYNKNYPSWNSNAYGSGSIVIPETVKYDNQTYRVTMIGQLAFWHCSNITEVTIPNSVESIETNAFQYCTSLTDVTIGNSVTSIGEYAFQNCTSLTQVTIPESVISIGSNAFYDCTSLTKVTIPNSVESIGEYAFQDCSSLTKLTIGSSVTSIGDYAFDGCSSLTEVTVPESVTSMGSYVFRGCTGLTKATINCPNTGENTFNGCTGLTTAILGEAVTTVGTSTFDSCEALESVTIGSSVSKIGNYAFYFCTSLSSITSLNPEPPTCSTTSFTYVDTSTCTLKVPDGAKDAYASADVWEDFVNIEEGAVVEEEAGDTGDDEGEGEGEDEGDDGGDITPDLESCATPSIGYEDQHLVFSCETEGVTYHYTMTCEDDCTETETTEGSVELSAVYNISVYATAEGYSSSETATAKLYFFGSTEEGEDDTTIIVPTEAIGVVVTTDGSSVTVSGLDDGEQVEAYTISGIKLDAVTASCGSATVNVGNTTGVVIIRFGNQTIKVKL